MRNGESQFIIEIDTACFCEILLEIQARERKDEKSRRISRMKAMRCMAFRERYSEMKGEVVRQ